MEPQIKKCCRCKQVFDNVKLNFYRELRKKDGFRDCCKKCITKSTDRAAVARRDSRRYAKSANKVKARTVARSHYPDAISFECSVLSCKKRAQEYHHVDYDQPLAVVPLCIEHHRANHSL
jgi:hypothetical protein